MGEATAYARIGGEAGVRRLVERFYALMDSAPEGRAARAIHGPDLQPSAEKLFLYLTGWLGGPPLFVERYGPPMLRRRHLHAPIGEAEVAAWLACFRQAWAETVSDGEITALVMPQIENLARHMRNQERSA